MARPRARLRDAELGSGPVAAGAKGSESSTWKPVAHGLPVVAGNVGGALDAVVHGETGLLVDPGDHVAVADAVSELLLDPGGPPSAARVRPAPALRLADDRRTGRGAAAPGRAARSEDLKADRNSSESVKVLYLNHTSQISGGERSLLSLLGGLPGESVRDRRLSRRAPGERGAGSRRSGRSIPGTDGSLKLHPWHTTRGVVDIARAAWAVRRLAPRLGADLIHANSIRAGLAACFAASIGRPPAVVHVRDCLPPGRISSLTLRAIGKRAAVVLAQLGLHGGELRSGPLTAVRASSTARSISSGSIPP